MLPIPFIEAKCTNCGAILPVEKDCDAWVCGYCGTPFIVEKAINLYNTTNNITAGTVNVYSTKDFDIRGGVLTRYNGEARDVVVPDGVVEIGTKAFSGCTGLKSITLPSSVEKICSGAFWLCSRLEKVVLPRGLVIDVDASMCRIKLNNETETDYSRFVQVGDDTICYTGGTFGNCTSLKTISIPEGTIFIHGKVRGRKIDTYGEKVFFYDVQVCNVFAGCRNLSEVLISEQCYKRNQGDIVFAGTPFLKIRKQKEVEAVRERRRITQQQEWQSRGRCQHCGGKISEKKGFLCKTCGKLKDY